MWEAWLVHTQTGQLTARLDVLSGSWEEAADSGHISLEVSKQSLRSVEPAQWLVPWRNSTLLTLDGLPVIGGPLTSVPRLGRTKVQIEAGSIHDIFAQRFATTADHTDGAALAQSTLTLDGWSLGSIGWRLVQAAMARRGGALPIVHGTLDEAAAHIRTYPGYDITNLDVAHLLELLAGVINGPDIRFDIEWADDEHRRVQWVMRHGTMVSTDIPQDMVLTIDTTAVRGPVGEPEVICAWTPVSKLYATGAGQDSATLIAIAEDESLMMSMPLLEATMSDTSTEELPLLQSRADARLARGREMTVQVNVAIDTATGRYPSLWHPGDAATVVLGDEWWPLPERMDGHIVGRSGEVGSSVVQVEIQSGVSL